MLDERDTLRDKVYTFFEGGNELWDEEGSTEWDDIDAEPDRMATTDVEQYRSGGEGKSSEKQTNLPA